MRETIFRFYTQKMMNTNTTRIALSVVLLLSVANLSRAETTKSGQTDCSDDTRWQETPSNRFFGLGDSLADSGIEVGFGLTNIYQQNVRGGTSRHRRAGRYTGSYDLELSADLQKLLGPESGHLFVHAEGGWPDTEGIDGVSVGSAFGVNADAIGNRTMDVIELFYERAIFDDALNLIVGKIDFTHIFDTSAYADDETSQFLNGALVDNPTIPFPDYSLGMVLSFNMTDSWYIMGGVADAQADRRTTGFGTAFDGKGYFLYIFEIGVAPELDSANGPMPGGYRAGLWNDPQPKANVDSSKNYRDDVGFYLSCDQMLAKENADPEDSQGLAVFVRYGYADSKRNDITNFWSVGFQYQGLIEDRDDDVLGVGFAQGIFSNEASTTYTDDHESALELYYSAQVTRWLDISPSVQYVSNPGGDKTVSDAVVLGVRAQIGF
jgi:carbohydrate-selective porin OprB